MNDYRLRNRFKVLRLHNIEQNYFEGIAKSESNLFKKLMFLLRFQSIKNTNLIF